METSLFNSSKEHISSKIIEKTPIEAPVELLNKTAVSEIPIFNGNTQIIKN